MTRILRLLPSLMVLWVLIACNRGPKTTIIELPKSAQLETNVDRNIHEVVAAEVLPAGNYVYVKVKEGNREFWISTGTQKVQKGSTYLYSEALLKTQFESKEHDRVFDTLYMVTTLIPKSHGLEYTKKTSSENFSEKTGAIKEMTVESTEMKVPFVGAVTISELVKDPKKYEGKKVELRGECTKVNPAILNRNWIHLKDGSQDDFDLVITSDEEVTKGATITIRGIVRLDKDFGSGYSYKILLEEGTVVR